MADAADSKSAVGDYVWVQLPSSALRPLNFEMNSKVIFFLDKIKQMYYDVHHIKNYSFFLNESFIFHLLNFMNKGGGYNLFLDKI